MYCEKCGKELDADAVFCENCGAKVIPIPPPVEEKAADDGMVQTGQMAGAMPTEGSQTGQMAGTMPTGGPQMGQVVGAMPTGGPQTGQPMGAMPRKPVKKSVIAAAILAILVIVGAVIGVNLYENRKTEIDLKSYYSIKFTGIAPNGEAEVEFDYDKFVRDYRGKIRTKLKGSDREIVEALVSDCGLADYSLKKSENLSNGDEVTLSIRTNDEKALKDYHVRFKSNRIMKKVSGLSYYVTKLSELKEEDLNNLKKTAEDALTAKIASEYSGYLAGQGMKYL
ncbi:MAG: zinc-ribbon domain-containing protein, partial [Lachnospiraceae bacterium]|nr:zinc-ribbon domain-containing protein [Lachnospiraceae bacterium]